MNSLQVNRKRSKRQTNNNIIMRSWTGRIMFQGDYRETDVDRVLEANRCYVCGLIGGLDNCSKCGGSGYGGDFEVFWEDDKRQDNVYEFINY